MSVLFAGGTSATVTPELDETSWIKGIIDEESSVSNVMSEAIDLDGFLHVSYYENNGRDLMYATNKGGIWATEIVDAIGDVGSFNYIAVDSMGIVHISYFDYTNFQLKYVVGSSGEWDISTVGTNDSVGKYNALAVDENGAAHIIYVDDHNDCLVYSNNTAGSWSFYTLADFQAYATSLSISDGGVLHAAFVGQSGKIYHAYGTGEDWTTETVDDAYTSYSTGIDIDLKEDNVYMVYESQGQNLKYAIRTGGAWMTQYVDNSTNFVVWASLDVDSYGRTHIIYNALASHQLHYALYDTNWGLYVLDEETGGTCSAIVSDYNDKQHVIFIDQVEDSSQLGYITNSGASWVIETVDDTGTSEKVSSIAVDALGHVHIAYTDSYVEENVTYSQLAYANNVDGWVVQTVDNSTDMTGLNPSIALDVAGNAYISYYDVSSTKVLKYATNVGGLWDVRVLDGTGNVGELSSIGVDSNGAVHIAYLNQGTHNLKYITNASDEWETTSVDTTNTVKGPISLGIDSQDVVHLAYYSDEGLIYSQKNGVGWNNETLESSNQLGGGISMFIDGADRIHITYYNTALTLLKYINNVEGTWNASIIESVGDVGAANAISVDDQGNQHIVYVDMVSDGIVKYAEKRSGIWMFQKVDLSGCDDQISMVMDQQYRVHMSYFDPDTMELKYASSLVVPTAPQNLTIDINAGSLTLNWLPPQSDGGSNITEYRIFRAPAGTSDFDLLATVGADSTFYVDSGLTNGVPFDYRIRAVNSEGSSQYASVTGTPCTLPGAPDLEASGRDKSVKLSWTEPENGGAAIEHYNIYRKNATGFWILIATVDGDETEYTDTGLENGVDYSYKVTAVNPAGEGPESDVATATANPSSDLMIMIIVVVIVIAAVGVGAFILFKRRPKA